MKVRPRLVLEATRIETAEQARSVENFPPEFPPKGWASFIGDYILNGPHGTFIAPAVTFEETYEVVDPV